jgi:hypothetical protein
LLPAQQIGSKHQSAPLSIGWNGRHRLTAGYRYCHCSASAALAGLQAWREGLVAQVVFALFKILELPSSATKISASTGRARSAPAERRLGVDYFFVHAMQPKKILISGREKCKVAVLAYFYTNATVLGMPTSDHGGVSGARIKVNRWKNA